MAARFRFLMICLLQFAALSFSSNAENNDFIVAGYLPDYRASINLNATLVHLTDVVLFSLTPASVVSGGGSSCCLSKEHFALVRKARSYKLEKTKSSIRILITIGGGGRSDGFADIVSGSSNTRHSFLHGIVKICRENELDGVDWDNENIQTYEQWEAYLHFLVEASTFLHKHNLLVSVALHPGQYLPSEVCRKVDRVHLMAYDMMHNQHSKHHASFKSVKKALSSFSSNGCPSSKLIMGIPAYARHESNPGKVKTYAEIVDEFLSEQDEHDVDTKEIITNLSSWKGYQFDSASDAKVKAEYAKDNDYGGCFLWELGQDKRISDVADGGVLTEAMSSVLQSDHIIGQKKGVDNIMKEGEL